MDRKHDLTARVARGDYDVDPQRVAEAMLRRRGRGLLMLVPASGERTAGGGQQHGSGPGLSAA